MYNMEFSRLNIYINIKTVITEIYVLKSYKKTKHY